MYNAVCASALRSTLHGVVLLSSYTSEVIRYDITGVFYNTRECVYMRANVYAGMREDTKDEDTGGGEEERRGEEGALKRAARPPRRDAVGVAIVD